MADHMAGINALPRWDPNNLDKGYNYDWKNYDPNDYAKFKAARAARDKAKVAKDKADLKQVRRDVAQVISDKVSEVTKTPKRHRLVWGGDSDCFADLEYSASDGGVWATFYRGGDTPDPYFYPMSREEAAAWFDDPSAGAYFNANVRE
jgi:hypothetical protein